MKIFDYWETWVIIYLLSAVIFSQTFKIANRNMKNAGSLTILLELFTAFFAILFIPFFKWNLPSTGTIFLTLFLVMIIYAITDRLNIEARYGLDPSTFSMLKQLSTVFLILFGFLILKEDFVLLKLIGAIIIILANFILTFESGKIKINKYFVMCFISNFLFAIAMLINVNISDSFNLGFYTFLTVFFPSCFIFLFERHSVKELKEEFAGYNKKYFFLAAFTWCLMLISSVYAYQIGSVSVIAPLFALTSILNAIVEYFVDKNRSKFVQKIIAAILLIIGVVCVKI